MTLSVDNIHVSFGDLAAVAGVSFTAAEGEIIGLLGPSGCGKSTLLRVISGLIVPDQGRVLWDGVDLIGVPVHKRGFGFMFQDGQLFSHKSVAANIEYGLPKRRFSRVERDARVAELLKLVGLEGYENRNVTLLSGGEKQRVALARALAPAPRVLLLDEPLSALDREMRERLALDLRGILRSTGTTAVFVTHDQDEAFTVCDRVAVMMGGKVLQLDIPERLWRHPATAQVAEFLGYEAVLSQDPFHGYAPCDFEVVESLPAGGADTLARQLGQIDHHGDPVDRSVLAALTQQPRTGGEPEQLAGTVMDKLFQSGRAIARVSVPAVGELTAALPSGLSVAQGDGVRLIRVSQ